MKPIALRLAVLALLCPTLAPAIGNPFNNDNDHGDECKRVSKAADKLHYIVKNSWGANGGNSKILLGADVQAEYDITQGKRWSEQLSAITVDPQTGEPLNCTAIRDKHADYLKAYEALRPKFVEAAKACANEADAVNGKCAKAVDATLKARNEFISSKLAPFVTAEKAGPLYCQAGFNGYLNGAALLKDGRLPEPCARPYYPGQKSICANIPLQNMRDAANGACKDNLNKIKDDPLLQGAKALCPSINKVRDGFEALRKDFNKPNKVFFEASIGAAVARAALLNLRRTACDAQVGTVVSPQEPAGTDPQAN